MSPKVPSDIPIHELLLAAQRRQAESVAILAELAKYNTGNRTFGKLVELTEQFGKELNQLIKSHEAFRDWLDDNVDLINEGLKK